MRRIDGATFAMGSDRFYPEEAPVRTVSVDPFWIDETPVTNAAFAAFVAATGHVTAAEIAPDPADYPGMPPELAQPGSAVFRTPAVPVPHHGPLLWWDFCLGADWRHPLGPESTLQGLEHHPVVHIAYADAEAFAQWAGKVLPTESEWELAARGGLDGADYAWGDMLAPDGQLMANYWHGRFPAENLTPDGWTRTSPVGSYPPNGYGLSDMIGNVWEWTATWFAIPSPSIGDLCCSQDQALGEKFADFPRKVLKGGSHLCAENYCRRYRPAARHPETIDTSTSHIGFRCVLRE